MLLRLNTVVRIIFLIVFVLLALDFVPIRMAVKISKQENLSKINIGKNETLFIAKNCQVTDSIWQATGDADGEHNMSKDIYFPNLYRNNPFNKLSSEFTLAPWEVRNKYVLVGNIVKEKTNNVETEIDFNVNKWYAVYPIERYSIRGLYAPKGYLTIYDFKWFDWFYKFWFK